MRRWGAALVCALAFAGLAWAWLGEPGASVRHFDDGPTFAFRAAGRWLRLNGRPDALVMDRKPFIPFYAGMRQALMPDDDYNTIVDYARATGVDYVVVEEYVMRTMRRQFEPLMTEPAFTRAERRLRMVYAGGGPENAGIAIFEVVR
jgi:hypothetical protein